jgi:ribonuclease R
MDIKEQILKILSEYDKKIEFEELYPQIGEEINPADIRQAVKELIGEGKVLVSKRGKLYLPGNFGHFTGKLDVKRLGFAFLRDKNGDIFISADNKMGAMDGDMVVVRLLSPAESDRKREGEVIGIIESDQKQIVGTLSGSFVNPDDERIEDIYIPEKAMGGAASGQKVVVRLEKRARGGKSPEGSIIEIIGTAGISKVEIDSCIKRLNLPDGFPQEVLNEAEQLSREEPAVKNREDFRKLNIFTIDGEDAKDFDDAVSINRIERGYELGVHIADVSHYVKEGSAIDREALFRGTSIYLADRVIPMLPEALSNGICSLSEGNDRLTLSCIMTIDESGKIVKSRIVKSIIKSKHRMSYTKVNAIFEGKDKKLIKMYKDIYDDLSEMRSLAEILRKSREEKGSIDFEIEETAFKYDEHGNVTDVGPRERGEAERLIEEFMLAANMTVAEEYYWREIPFVYRVHEQPDDEKIRAFAAFYSNFGKIKGKVDNIHPKVLQNILKDIKGTTHENIVNQIMLRSLKKAEYSPQCKGHFGLSFQYYCHFTSPIRRYPDLEVHRIIKKDLKGELTLKYIEILEGKVDEISRQSSIRERVAMEAERAVDDMKKAEFMRANVGEEFNGIVSGVLKNVIFVELDNTVEGVIPLSSLHDDYYVYNEKLYCIIGERTRKRIALGDEMRVEVVSVSVYPPRIEFEPVSSKHVTQRAEDFLG